MAAKIKSKIIELAKRHHALMRLLRALMFVFRRVKYFLCGIGITADEKTVIFESFMGRSYSDNPRALYEAMLRDPRFSDGTFVWCFTEPEKKRGFAQLDRAVLVKYGSRDYYRYYHRAGYIVSNSRIPEEIYVTKKQSYVQTWHGTPLKKLGYDIEVEGGNAMNTVGDICRKYRSDAKRYSYLISPSQFCTDKLRSAFRLDGNAPGCEVIQAGYPRNDFLSNYTENDVFRIKSTLGLQNETRKIRLYAPTWRDDQHRAGLGYTYECPVDFDLLREKLGGGYVILFRAHYFVANSFDFGKYADFIHNVSDYEDISELYAISDLLVTDYSSVFFDYAILRRPIVFYMYDYEQYAEKLRGFYLDPHSLPWPIAYTETELARYVLAARDGYNKEFYDAFLSLEDGKASERILERIRRKI